MARWAARSRWPKRRVKAHRSGLYVLSLSVEEGDDSEGRVIEALEARVPEADVQSVSYTEGLHTVHCRFNGVGVPSAAEFERVLAGVASVRQVDVFYNMPD